MILGAPVAATRDCIWWLHAALGRGGTWPAEQQVALDWEQVAGILDVRLGGGLGG
jgi:hypothetical protein